MITFGSVCSGIEAASVAWHPLGWRAEWLAEIEKFPSEVLKYHYPEVPNLGDMTNIADKVKAGEVAAPDVLVGGTPCQAFSVAGMREGLADPRGELTIRYVELADAIDDVRRKRGEQPAIIVWENVPGVLSSKDNAFGCFLGALAGEDSELQPAGKKWGNAGCVYGPKRAIAWRVLDAQYFGLAQRRNRVFLVASARDGFDPAKILFEFDSVRRDSAPSRKKGQEVAVDASTSSGAANPVVGALCARDFKGVGNQYVSEGKLIIERPYQDVSHCLNAGGMGRQDYETESFVVHSSTQENAIDLICVHGTQDPIISMERAHSLGRNAGQENAVLSFAQNSRDEVRLIGGDGQISGALSANPGMKQTTYIAHSYGIPGNWIGRKPENGGNAVEPMHDISPCLTVTDRHGVAAYSFDSLASNSMKSANPHSGCRLVDLSKTIDTTVPCPSKNQGGICILHTNMRVRCLTQTSVDRHGVLPINTMTVQGRPSDDLNPRMGSGIGSPGDPQNTLTKAHMHGVFDPEIMRVRRLTPVECERLQGFPDNYTQIEWRGKSAEECPDGNRYKALGNSMAVPCMAWIGESIHRFLG